MKDTTNAWQGFQGGLWTATVSVRNFIQSNFESYDGDESFLAGPTPATTALWKKVSDLQKRNAAKAESWIWRLMSSRP